MNIDDKITHMTAEEQKIHNLQAAVRQTREELKEFRMWNAFRKFYSNPVNRQQIAELLAGWAENYGDDTDMMCNP